MAVEKLTLDEAQERASAWVRQGILRSARVVGFDPDADDGRGQIVFEVQPLPSVYRVSVSVEAWQAMGLDRI